PDGKPPRNRDRLSRSAIARSDRLTGRVFIKVNPGKLMENSKMTRNNLTMTLVGALTVICGLTEHGSTQAPAKQSPRQAPIFQVDSTWPQIPNNWILGPVSSV